MAIVTMNRYLCWLSRLMYHAVSQRLIHCNPFGNAKYKKAEQKIRFLQKSEVAKLTTLKILNKQKRQARRIFSVLKAWQLLIWNICNLNISRRQSTDKERYIRKEWQKTKVEFIVPLHSIVEALINQCKEEQPMNKERQMVKEKAMALSFTVIAAVE